MDDRRGHFEQLTPIERVLNKLFGALVGLGLGLSHNYLLHTLRARPLISGSESR
jgi:hypothetical protein